MNGVKMKRYSFSMSLPGIPTVQPQFAWAVGDAAEQRSTRRYPIRLDVEFKLPQEKRAGSGTTLNVSSGGILFQTDETLPAFGSIEISIKWPFALDGGCALKLVMRGRIVRQDRTGIAVKVRQHEFRTAGASRGASA